MLLMSMFINRESEKKSLKNIYNSEKAELVLIYGRRRIGKSRLIVETIKNENAIYFLADTSDNILDILANQTNEPFIKFSDWDNFFEFILKSKYEIFVIDEFQYICQVEKSWPTILQRWWEKIKDSKKKIILCGSIISAIYKITRGYNSALYGRKTREIKIAPLKFKHIFHFFPNYEIEEILKTYFILGGIPRYLEEFDNKKNVEQNMLDKIFEKSSFLYNEPINLLSEEFRDFSSYLAILLGISEGKTKFNEISTYSRISTNKLSKYLSVLERVEIIQKEIPITETKLKSKITRYCIIDNYYSFWLNFVMKNKSQIEQGLFQNITKSMHQEINTYFGKKFEKVCQEIFLEKIKGINKIGKWWYKDKEIDIIALDEAQKNVYFVECKWQDNVDPQKVLENLKEKSKSVVWNNNERQEHFVIFAKSFSKKIDNVLLIDMNDLMRFFSVLKDRDWNEKEQNTKKIITNFNKRLL